MSSRDSILSQIRKTQVPPAAHPGRLASGIRFADREKQFFDVLTFVGGRGHVAENVGDPERIIRGLPVMESAKRIACTVPGLNLATFDLNDIADPHDLADVDVAILPGQFAVAENAAIWVTDLHVKHRAIYFLTQHLVLVVPRGEMLDNLHQAYERLAFAGPSYGLFISGPSKTADIEQSLVIGAHGPRSLEVILMGTAAKG